MSDDIIDVRRKRWEALEMGKDVVFAPIHADPESSYLDVSGNEHHAEAVPPKAKTKKRAAKSE